MSVEALNLLTEKLGDGWVGGGWVVSTEIKDWTEPINNCGTERGSYRLFQIQSSTLESS